jgi:hypothetical protein
LVGIFTEKRASSRLLVATRLKHALALAGKCSPWRVCGD